MPTKRSPRIEFRRALETVQGRLTDGVYAAGKVLPSERQLATDLGISRNTLRRLFTTLIEEGRIDADHRVLGAAATAIPAVAASFGPTVLVVDDLLGLDPDRMRQPGWLERILHTTRNELRKAGLACLTIEPQRLLDLPPHPSGALVGVILGLGGGRMDLERLASRLRGLGTPIIALGTEPAMHGFDRVWSDHAAGAEAAATWLLARGRRRILPLLTLANQWQRDRYAGYRRAMDIARVPHMEPLALDHPDFGDEISLAFWARRTAELLAPHVEAGVDAILAISDFEIPLLVHALRRLGKEPNRDVDLIGYDHVWPEVTSRRFSDIGPLATIDKRNERMGTALVELLLGRLRGQLPPEPQQLAVPPLLVELPV